MNNKNQKLKDKIAARILPIFEDRTPSRVILVIIMIFVLFICHFSNQIGLSVTTMVGFFLVLILDFGLTFSKNNTVKEASLFIAILLFICMINAIGLFAAFYLFSTVG